MKDENVIEILPEDIEIIQNKEYKSNIKDCFINLPKVANSIMNYANHSFEKIESLLYTAPAFMNMIKATVPEVSYQTILNSKQKGQLAKGAVKLMTKSDGTLMANLVDTKTKKIVSTISLKEMKLTPEITKAISDFSTQMQLAQIAEQMQLIQFAVEEIKQGQEHDSLATAYSCQQKLLQILEMKNQKLRTGALLNLAFDAEDSRNLLMQSQSDNLAYIKNQPEDLISKFFKGAKNKEIGERMEQIRENFTAVNMVSLVEAIAYQEIGEISSAQLSLEYYANYIHNTYLSDKGLIERLDLIDPSPTNYWTKNLPSINNKLQELSKTKELFLKEGSKEENENKKMQK